MKRVGRAVRAGRFSATAAAVLTVASVATACGDPTFGPETESEEPEDTGWVAFTLDAVSARRQQLNVDYLEFFTAASLRGGLYHQRVGVESDFLAHFENVVYYVVAGSATLAANDVEFDVQPGSAFFVGGRTEHWFRRVDADLEVLVVFGQGISSVNDPEVVSLLPEDLVARRSVFENVLHLLVEASTLRLAMFMLPRELGGAGSQGHANDEIILVTRGGGRLDLGAQGITVEAGAILFIQAGVSHEFRNLSDDMEIVVVRKR